jgi:hypothetical protein
VAKAVDQIVDKDIHRSVTGCGRSMDSIRAGFLGLYVADIKDISGVLHEWRALHNHSNNLSLRI